MIIKFGFSWVLNLMIVLLLLSHHDDITSRRLIEQSDRFGYKVNIREVGRTTIELPLEFTPIDADNLKDLLRPSVKGMR